MVDLDALAKELVDAGCHVWISYRGEDGIRVYWAEGEALLARVNPDGYCEFRMRWPKDWSVIDIIRKHIEGTN